MARIVKLKDGRTARVDRKGNILGFVDDETKQTSVNNGTGQIVDIDQNYVDNKLQQGVSNNPNTNITINNAKYDNNVLDDNADINPSINSTTATTSNRNNNTKNNTNVSTPKRQTVSNQKSVDNTKTPQNKNRSVKDVAASSYKGSHTSTNGSYTFNYDGEGNVEVSTKTSRGNVYTQNYRPNKGESMYDFENRIINNGNETNYVKNGVFVDRNSYYNAQQKPTPQQKPTTTTQTQTRTPQQKATAEARKDTLNNDTINTNLNEVVITGDKTKSNPSNAPEVVITGNRNKGVLHNVLNKERQVKNVVNDVTKLTQSLTPKNMKYTSKQLYIDDNGNFTTDSNKATKDPETAIKRQNDAFNDLGLANWVGGSTAAVKGAENVATKLAPYGTAYAKQSYNKLINEGLPLLEKSIRSGNIRNLKDIKGTIKDLKNIKGNIKNLKDILPETKEVINIIKNRAVSNTKEAVRRGKLQAKNNYNRLNDKFKLELQNHTNPSAYRYSKKAKLKELQSRSKYDGGDPTNYLTNVSHPTNRTHNRRVANDYRTAVMNKKIKGAQNQYVKRSNIGNIVDVLKKRAELLSQ